MNLPNPIKLVVPLTDLQKTKKFKFNHSCSLEELSDLTEILRVKKLKKFSFKGQFIQSSKMNYTLQASLQATLLQPCVISLSTVKIKIDRTIEQYYSVEEQKNINKSISIDSESIEIEQLHRETNIGDIMIEALSLEIPLYPKKNNADFEEITVTEAGIEPLDLAPNNPFLVLKKFQ
ncbi:MAG: hypothetical protein P8M50_05195 [Paracoccaceae bacterium]|nr:hypothetical protein [Paracoccaceae bacterium]